MEKIGNNKANRLDKKNKLSIYELNSLFIKKLNTDYVLLSSINEKPLLISLPIGKIEKKLRIYIFNCTNPPGGRQLDEYKIQLIMPNQKRGERGRLDFSDDCIVLLVGYAQIGLKNDDGVFILWDPLCHEEFAYSTNVQIRYPLLINAVNNGIGINEKRGNKEIVITARTDFLLEAIIKRIAIVSDVAFQENKRRKKNASE